MASVCWCRGKWFQMPTELPKVAISTVLLPLPFGFYVVGFAIIFFPRLVLTRHFWTDTQRNEFFRKEILRSMAISSRLEEIIGNPKSIEDVRLPSLEELSGAMLVALARVYSMFPFPGIGRRFMLRCQTMRQLDKVLAESINSLTRRQLIFHLFVRRILITEDASDAEMRETLADWIKFTNRLDDAAYLCAPIFFNKKKLT
ncbi:LETM1-like protein [Dictyocaulus viviparus]|uniref:LETM1-like protein n=1 Tax=Dictyocaulus viviparus TaxID=29172 RepID=A0A0D8Y5V6_DICVI|nr:LETM1-like protein [Dictyocaulus viviparus]